MWNRSRCDRRDRLRHRLSDPRGHRRRDPFRGRSPWRHPPLDRVPGRGCGAASLNRDGRWAGNRNCGDLGDVRRHPFVFEDRLAEAHSFLDALHPLRRPPAVVSEQFHHRGYQEHADHGRVEDQRGDHAVGDVLHHHQFRERERAGDDDQDQCGRGDDPAGVGGADAHRLGGAGALRAGLDHAGEQEHLVVGGQTVDDRHDQHQHR